MLQAARTAGVRLRLVARPGAVVRPRLATAPRRATTRGQSTAAAPPHDPPPIKRSWLGKLITDFMVDHPRWFFGSIFGAIFVWVYRLNLASDDKESLIDALEVLAPLAPREVQGLSRSNKIPLSVMAAFWDAVWEEGKAAGGWVDAADAEALLVRLAGEAAAAGAAGGSGSSAAGGEAAAAAVKLQLQLHHLMEKAVVIQAALGEQGLGAPRWAWLPRPAAASSGAASPVLLPVPVLLSLFGMVMGGRADEAADAWLVAAKEGTLPPDAPVTSTSAAGAYPSFTQLFGTMNGPATPTQRMRLYLHMIRRWNAEASAFNGAGASTSRSGDLLSPVVATALAVAGRRVTLAAADAAHRQLLLVHNKRAVIGSPTLPLTLPELVAGRWPVTGGERSGSDKEDSTAAGPRVGDDDTGADASPAISRLLRGWGCASPSSPSLSSSPAAASSSGAAALSASTAFTPAAPSEHLQALASEEVTPALLAASGTDALWAYPAQSRFAKLASAAAGALGGSSAPKTLMGLPSASSSPLLRTPPRVPWFPLSEEAVNRARGGAVVETCLREAALLAGTERALPAFDLWKSIVAGWRWVARRGGPDPTPPPPAPPPAAAAAAAVSRPADAASAAAAFGVWSSSELCQLIELLGASGQLPPARRAARVGEWPHGLHAPAPPVVALAEAVRETGFAEEWEREEGAYGAASARLVNGRLAPVRPSSGSSDAEPALALREDEARALLWSRPVCVWGQCYEREGRAWMTG